MRTVEIIAGVVIAAVVLAYLTSSNGPELINQIAGGASKFVGTLMPGNRAG